MRFLGAKVVLTPAAQRGMGMVVKAVELAKTRGCFLTRQFENEANPDMHSRTAAREIIADFASERLAIGSPAMAPVVHSRASRAC
jgi:cysteine synthase A